MVVYYVSWKASDELTKGKGRATKQDYMMCFTVLCRNISDASSCLEYLFDKNYRGKFSLGDGEVSFKRKVLDSRSFEIHYLMMDGMSKPLYLSDCKSSIDSYHSSPLQRSVYSSSAIKSLH